MPLALNVNASADVFASIAAITEWLDSYGKAIDLQRQIPQKVGVVGGAVCVVVVVVVCVLCGEWGWSVLLLVANE